MSKVGAWRFGAWRWEQYENVYFCRR